MDTEVVTGKPNSIVPLFLLKTFSILETSDPSIVAWSEIGDSFLVKDANRFGSEIIPSHFNHNKFSSFIRQLNFYGFRKVKGKISVGGKSEQNSWEFRHPNFRRGQPELLHQIKRSSAHAEEMTAPGQVSPDEAKTILVLQQNVNVLTAKVEALSRTVEDMQRIINQYQQQEAHFLSTEDNSPVAPGSSDDDVSTDDWDINDDDLLMTFLEDLNDGPLPDPPSLKRRRSVDNIVSLLEEPSTQVAKTSDIGGVNSIVDMSDPAVVQAVASAVALSGSTGLTSTPQEQYVAAVAAILSCAGMPQSQALATSAEVLSQTAIIKNKSDVQSILSQQPLTLSV